MKTKYTTFLSAVLCVLGAALLKGAGAAAADRNPCDQDIKRLCQKETDRAKPKNCIERHLKELSQPCRSLMDEYAAENNKVSKACNKEYMELCGKSMSKTHKLKCLEEHESFLSNDCKQALSAYKEKMGSLRERAPNTSGAGKKKRAKPSQPESQ